MEKEGLKKVSTGIKKVEKEIIKTVKLPFNHQKLTIGQRAADFIAKWAGSWTFIISFFVLLGLWITANIYMWINQWDPYPFILLNLVLSTLAAVQAPVILMSQNRAAQRDRIRAEYDYAVNRRAEKMIEEIRDLLKKRK